MGNWWQCSEIIMTHTRITNVLKSNDQNNLDDSSTDVSEIINSLSDAIKKDALVKNASIYQSILNYCSDDEVLKNNTILNLALTYSNLAEYQKADELLKT